MRRGWLTAVNPQQCGTGLGQKRWLFCGWAMGVFFLVEQKNVRRTPEGCIPGVLDALI